jgi:hypothetical protein
VLDDGRGSALYVAGVIPRIGGMVANNVARWDGVAWEGLGGGIPPFSPNYGDSITALESFPAGGVPAIWAGGFYDNIGGTAAVGIARFSCVCPDLDDDGSVGLSDLALLLPEFAGTPTLADIDQDGDVDLQDLSALLAAFGSACPR